MELQAMFTASLSEQKRQAVLGSTIEVVEVYAACSCMHPTRFPWAAPPVG